MSAITVAYIFERYPVLTQTFLRRELAGLSQAGLRVEVYSMVGPGNNFSAKEEPNCIPVRHFRGWHATKLLVAVPRELRRDPKLLRDGWRLWREHRFKDWENFWATVWAIVFALCSAPQFRQRKPDILHGVRATGPATAATVLSRLCGIPFSFGAHAYDIYRHGGDAFLKPKLHAARFVHTTTATAEKHLRECAEGVAINIVLARRGIERLPEKLNRVQSERPIAMLSVGRLVAKKGHFHQIAACALLKSRGVPFIARIIGDGPLRDHLQSAIERAGLQNCVTLRGAVSPEEIADEYAWADIFWHTGIVDSEGDRDGLPNVIPEAMAYGLPVIASNLPGNTEAVENGINGMVVDAANAESLAKVVKSLAEDTELRKKFGENGRRWVEQNFLISRNAEILAEAFRGNVPLKSRMG
jgi:glycosyltransferase involved in cell wall biosynthesis